MGYALAREAWVRGADVTLISGPGSLEPPAGVRTIRIETTENLMVALGELLPTADVLVMAAAPADFRPKRRASAKTRRAGGPLTLELEPTEDVLLGTLGRRKDGAVMVGFALETGDAVAGAREKLASKRLDMVIANDATEPGAGPEVRTNRVAIVTAGAVEQLPRMSKEDVAAEVLDRVAQVLASRGA
jgi:phosphopantothenoylcysteine decarboxylase/phosphopantothenate--cysteine ligase